jgi:hypothetical protein
MALIKIVVMVICKTCSQSGAYHCWFIFGGSHVETLAMRPAVLKEVFVILSHHSRHAGIVPQNST